MSEWRHRHSGLAPLAATASPEHFDLTDLFAYWQAGANRWKACVKHACKRFRQQERMMSEILAMHKTFCRILGDAGATFDPSPLTAGIDTKCAHVCHCGRSFTNPQGLACHKRQQHSEIAPERTLIDGATCPAWPGSG